MKKILLIATVAAFAACNNSDNAKVESMNAKDSSKMDNMNYPYTAEYSSKFEMGDPKNAMTVLQVYKDWDNNTIDNSKNSFAETNDTLSMATGDMLTGNRDSIFATVSKMRATMGTIKDEPHAWVSLKSTDKNEDWVIVWTREIATNNGKTDTTELQETWRLDKNGKINTLYQYAAKPAKMMPPPPPTKK